MKRCTDRKSVPRSSFIVFMLCFMIVFTTLFQGAAFALSLENGGAAYNNESNAVTGSFSIDAGKKITYAGTGSAPAVRQGFQFGLYDYSWNLIATSTVMMDEWGVDKTLPEFTLENGRALQNGNYYLREIIPNDTGDWEYSTNTVILICSLLDSGPYFTSWASRKFENVYTGTGGAIVPTTYTITATAGEGGAVAGGGVYDEGDAVRLIAAPDNNYIFDGWYENGVIISEAGATYEFKAAANRTLEARFTGEYLITITGIAPGNGQCNVYFDIVSANGKEYAIYISDDINGPFTEYSNVNYNSKGAHLKGLTNGETYYVYVVYNDGKEKMIRSEAVAVTASK